MIPSFAQRSAAAAASLALLACTGLAGLPNAHAQAPAASAPLTADALPAPDRQWVQETAATGMAEVDMGRMAQQKGHADAVRQFGARMVQDHSKANDELLKLVAGKGLQLPANLPGQAGHKKQSDHLNAQTGPAFDRAFMTHMVDGHVKAVASFEQQARAGKDADLKAFAARTLPTLRDHLASAKSIQANLK